MITVHLNGELREAETGIDLVRLLEYFSLPSQRVAVELNGRVVPRLDWLGTRVNDGDRVEVVHFVGGG